MPHCDHFHMYLLAVFVLAFSFEAHGRLETGSDPVCRVEGSLRRQQKLAPGGREEGDTDL